MQEKQLIQTFLCLTAMSLALSSSLGGSASGPITGNFVLRGQSGAELLALPLREGSQASPPSPRPRNLALDPVICGITDRS